MTLKALKFFKKDSKEDIEVALYDSSEEKNYFESFHPLVIEDSYKGVIVCLQDVLVKKNASFSGELICTRCVIEGTFSGSLLCTEYTEIGRSASLDAEILTGSIFIENKAAAVGEFRITKDIKIPESFNKLQSDYTESLNQIEEAEREPKRIKKIILKKGLTNTGSKLSAEVSPSVEVNPSAEINPTVEVNPIEIIIEPNFDRSNTEITIAQPQLSVMKEEIPSDPNSGWW